MAGRIESATARPVMVTGASGQVGRALTRAAWPDGWCGVPLDRAHLDLRSPADIAARIAGGHEGQPWAAVVNAAAYTAVDRAEDDIAEAWAVNALAPATLSMACRLAGIPLVQVSTDYVFSGEQTAAWTVFDAPNPIGVYGGSKLGGELAVSTSGARHAIVRTSWVVSADGQNFVKTMLRLARERDAVSVVEDQRGSPTSAADLADALVVVATRLAGDPAAASGVYHFANAGPTTWADFAREIFGQSAARGGPTATVNGIATADYPTRARRPVNSLLDTTAIGSHYGVVPRPWQAALKDILDDLIGARA